MIGTTTLRRVSAAVSAKAQRAACAILLASLAMASKPLRAEPAHYLPSSSYNYGVGAFLLAGAQVAEMSAHVSHRANAPGALP